MEYLNNSENWVEEDECNQNEKSSQSTASQ